jgi:penicillin-binding protein 2
LSQIPVKRDISEKEFALLEEKKIEISGLTVTQEPIRRYDNKNLASHILGYVGEIGDDQMKQTRYKDARAAGDIIGQTGIENFYDEVLRGQDGQKLILTDASGKQKEIIKTIPPVQGKNLVLTIDSRLQRFAENLLIKHNYRGVIIAQDPRSGEIMCMASEPDFNLQYFSGGVDTKEWKNLLRNKAYPLTNRAVQGLYSPGSIFKVAVGSGALNENVITTKDTFLCEGIYWIKTWPYKCWKRAGHGWMDFYHAVAESCDIYFYKVGLKMKVELLNKYGTMFGLGEKTGIDLPGEKAGLVPSREWKLREDRSPWFPGNTVMMAIGQGYVTATPLQIMNIMTVMANSGFVMVPHLLKAVTLDGRRIDSLYTPSKLFQVDVKPDVIHTMNAALKLDVMTSYGTGHKARVEGLTAAGKTATVENPHGDNHAMFVGYAPFDKPELVVYVLIEFGGGGGEAAAPLAGEIFQYYFNTLRDK